jgi:hypothetical protein
VGPRTGLDDVEKILDPIGTPTPTPSIVQPVASRHTDCAIPDPLKSKVVPVLNQLSTLFHEDIWGSGGIVPPFCDLGTGWR